MKCIKSNKMCNIIKWILGTSWIVGLYMAQGIYARQLPLEQISDPGCKALHWTDHSSDCKIDFERPDQTVFSWPWNATEKLHFSVLFKGSYSDGYSGIWGHPGLDIVSAKWTPLYSIWPGVITRAEWINGYGNTVVVQHQDGEETIYSNYAHMDVISVVEWQIVQEWQKIWEIGNTGFTMWALGNHVDFQITKQVSPSHPYGHTACPQWYREATKSWVCNDILDKYTYDPLVFLKQKIANQDLVKASDDLLWISKKAIDTKKITVDTSDIYAPTIHTSSNITNPIMFKDTNMSNEINPIWYTIYAHLLESITTAQTFDKLFLEIYFDGVLLDGILSQPIRLDYRPSMVDFYTDKVTQVIDGKKQLLFKTKEAGQTQINIMMWDTRIAVVPLEIQ